MSDDAKGAAGPLIPITVEFTYFSQASPSTLIQPSLTRFDSGGLELLFGNERKHKISLPACMEDGNPTNIAYLLPYLVNNLMQDQRTDMFIMEDNVYVESELIAGARTDKNFSRPGILVLINDADWELEGEETYELQPGDNIVFVSTLHGG
ncbi:Ubiquitin-related modifier 1 [Penicillium rolfsii]|nr:Ubiquitin-related modifier 1 [Penicillium rolfsii]